MKKNLFIRIFSGYAVLAAILSAIILFFSISAVKTHYMKAEEANLKQFLIVLKARVEPAVNSGSLSGMDPVIKKMGAGSEVRFTVIAPDGGVLADSESDPASMDNHINRPEVRGALESKEGSAVRYSNTLKEDMLYHAERVVDGKGAAKAVIRASIPLKDIRALTDSLNREIFKAFALVLAAALIAAYFLSRQLYLPIKELIDASQKVASGDFNTRVTIAGGGEMKDLADNFNIMTGQIKELFGGLSEKKGQLDAIIDAVAEGLIVTDEKGRIVLMNKSFKKISGTECSEGNFYWECFMPVRFNAIVEGCLKNKAGVTEQVEIKDRVFLCSAVFLEEKKQGAFVLYDITEFKELERIKKDFVANVSHELRTPLTAIKGFAETLEHHTKSAEEIHYIEIIKKNTERLINIVADLLTLSQLEQMEKLIETEKVDIRQLVDNAVKIFEQPIRAKGLALNIKVEPGMPAIKGDLFRLEQVIINLIDNAVKYTEKGSIDVSVSEDPGTVKIVISDTGIGIPREHLSRVFERFYVIDKSRSRKLGGTGLGLSIVKHIVLLHNGKISVESTQGKGTAFTIVLPV